MAVDEVLNGSIWAITAIRYRVRVWVAAPLMTGAGSLPALLMTGRGCGLMTGCGCRLRTWCGCRLRTGCG